MNSKQISIYKSKYAVILMFCVLLSYVIPDDHFLGGYVILGIVGLVELFYFYKCSYRINKNFVFSILFVTILYVFHFGQVVLLAFLSNNLTDVKIVLGYFDEKACFSGLRIMNLSFALISLGILLKMKPTFGNRVTVIENYPNNCENNLILYRKVAKGIIKYLFPVKIALDLYVLFLSFTVDFDYATRWLSAFPDIPKTFAEFSYIGWALLLISYKGDRKKTIKVFIFILCYMFLMMASGRRSESVAYLCGFLYLFMRIYGKINIRSLISYGMLGFVALTILTVVRQFRGDVRDFSMLIDGFFLAIKNPQIIIDILREYGDTGYTALSVIILWLPKYGMSFGTSYIYGLSAIFPNIGGIAGKLSTESAFAVKLQDAGVLYSEYSNIGGSMIGELFFNFGISGGIVFSLILGMVIGTVFNIIEYNLTKENFLKVAALFPMLCNMTYWVRDSFVGGIRPAIWGVLFSYIVFVKIYKLSYKK